MNKNFIVIGNDAENNIKKAFQHPLRKQIFSAEDGEIVRFIKKFNDYEYYRQRIAWGKYLCLNSGLLVHRLVWECFYGELIPKNFVIDHVDGNTKNNHISNLEAISHSKNIERSKKSLNKEYANRKIHIFPCSTILDNI